jgi:hypothetical protein
MLLLPILFLLVLLLLIVLLFWQAVDLDTFCGMISAHIASGDDAACASWSAAAAQRNVA